MLDALYLLGMLLLGATLTLVGVALTRWVRARAHLTYHPRQ